MSLLDNEGGEQPLHTEPTGTFTPSSILGEDGTFKADANWKEALEPLGLGENAGAFNKYKSLGDFFKGHHNAVKLATGKTQGLVPPTDDSDEAAVAAWRKGLGVPDSVDGYDIKAPEDLPEGVEFSPEAVKPYLDLLHKHHASPALVQELVNLNIMETGRQAGDAAHNAELAQAQQLEEEGKKLSQEFGATLPTVIDKAKRAAAAIGLDPASNPIFNSADNVKAFAKLADLVGEDALPNDLRSASQARYSEAQDIMTNPQNPKYELYYQGDESVNRLVQEGLKARP